MYPIGPLAEVVAVDPDLAVLVDAVELDRDLAVLVRRRDAKVLAVPADAGGRIAAGAAAGLVLGERPLDAPVVRQVEAAPVGVGEGRLLGAGRIALEELPAEVESVANARRRGGDLGRELASGGEPRPARRLPGRGPAGRGGSSIRSDFSCHSIPNRYAVAVFEPKINNLRAGNRYSVAVLAICACICRTP